MAAPEVLTEIPQSGDSPPQESNLSTLLARNGFDPVRDVIDGVFVGHLSSADRTAIQVAAGLVVALKESIHLIYASGSSQIHSLQRTPEEVWLGVSPAVTVDPWHAIAAMNKTLTKASSDIQTLLASQQSTNADNSSGCVLPIARPQSLARVNGHVSSQGLNGVNGTHK